MRTALVTGRVVHCKRDPFDVYVGRPSEWGNPYSHKPHARAIATASREEAIERFRRDLWLRISMKEEGLVEKLAGLAGKTLGCWCAPEPCHGEVIAAAAIWAANELLGKGE